MSLTEPEPEKATAPEDSSDDKENTQAEETVKDTFVCEFLPLKNSSMPSLNLFNFY